MSQGNEDGTTTTATPDPGTPSDDLTAEIDRTMAEAAAAVTALDPDAPADAGEQDDGELVALKVRVEELETQVAATKDKWLRAVADLENFKKRSKRELADQKIRTSKAILPSFLTAMDNLDRALEVAEPAATNASADNSGNVENLVKGMKMVRDEFLGALARNGIDPVATVGTSFDPAMHDALQQIDSPDHPPGVVIREFEKGYMMAGKLLRPARVIVAGAGSTGVVPHSPTDEPSDGSED